MRPNRSAIPRRAVPATLLVGIMVVGCGDGGAPVPAERALVVRQLPSPASEGPSSGMPFVSATDRGALLSWLEATGTVEGEWALRTVELDASGQAESVRNIAVRRDFFVNWADFPSVTSFGADRWIAHWLQRGPEGGYDYGVRISTSSDRGLTWTEPWTAHGDGTPTEHGFVSVLPVPDGYQLVWLDGRNFVAEDEAAHSMQLRAREGGVSGPLGPEEVVDPRICDCCQTDVAATEDGAVAVYRDRTEAEIRDIGTALWSKSAGWTRGDPVHEDGWEIAGCPVNGPAVAARGNDVVAVWFTAAQDTARVRAAFSTDGGRTFAPPIRLDGGSPMGRVDVVFAAGGEAWAAWMEQRGNGTSELVVVRVNPDGVVGSPVPVAANSAARNSGFPRMAALSDTSAVIAWTDSTEPASRIRLALIEFGGP